MDETEMQPGKYKREFRRFSIDEMDLQRDQLSFIDHYQFNCNGQPSEFLSGSNDNDNDNDNDSHPPMALTQSLCFIDSPSQIQLATSLSSALYIKPCCLSAKPSFSASNENEIFHLLYDDPYTNLMPLTIADETGLCYATLPHGKLIDISSLYFKSNVSPSMFDMQETQSPKEKRIARVVMAVAVLLLTMCVVLVGATLSMSGYIDSMVRELYKKRNSNLISMPKTNISEPNTSLYSYLINTTEKMAE